MHLLCMVKGWLLVPKPRTGTVSAHGVQGAAQNIGPEYQMARDEADQGMAQFISHKEIAKKYDVSTCGGLPRQSATWLCKFSTCASNNSDKHYIRTPEQ